MDDRFFCKLFFLFIETNWFFDFSFGHFEDVRLAAIDCLVDLTKSKRWNVKLLFLFLCRMLMFICV